MKEKSFLLIFVFGLFFSAALAENDQWEYAQFSTFSWQGELRAEWITSDDKVSATGGVLPLAEKVMGQLISDTDNAFIVWFNYLGSKGWELVSVREVRQDSTLYLFKRKKNVE